MKTTLTIFLILITHFIGFSQNTPNLNTENQIQKGIPNYVYIKIEKRTLSKKLKVDVDLGDTPEQKKTSEEYSDILSNSKSYAAVLNFMADKGFDLVQTLDLNRSYEGSGGTSGIVFIMKHSND